ncbi:Protein kinase C gamma type [Frankliniella fusca]|uniref:Protein kinase C gamma type n=1 Tax=Frankliniella fusca TaxID=407009 RepID=A0AAE1H0Z8_9NEOP|nr:Protein kinase C gamma type [Frankliniella fusca]
MKERYDLRARRPDLREGDLVWFYNPRRKIGRTSKLCSWWEGPFIILSKLNEVTFRIRQEDKPLSKPRVVHADRLSPAVPRISRHRTDTKPTTRGLVGWSGRPRRLDHQNCAPTGPHVDNFSAESRTKAVFGIGIPDIGKFVVDGLVVFIAWPGPGPGWAHVAATPVSWVGSARPDPPQRNHNWARLMNLIHAGMACVASCRGPERRCYRSARSWRGVDLGANTQSVAVLQS